MTYIDGADDVWAAKPEEAGIATKMGVGLSEKIRRARCSRSGRVGIWDNYILA
jgi:hypothetical protein